MLLDLGAGSGAVRLDPEGWEALLAAHAGSPGAHPEAVVALASGRLDRTLAAVAEPLATFTVVVAGVDVRQEHRGWAAPDTLALLLAVHGAEHQLVTQDPDLLAAALVRIARIRPRRTTVVAEPRPVDAACAADLVSGDTGRRRGALAEVEADLAWTLTVAWAGGGRQLTAVDGPAGLHLLDPTTGLLRPTSNTAAYRILSTVLPTDQELAATP